MSQLPVPYAPRHSLVTRVRRTWPMAGHGAVEWGALFGLAVAALGSAAAIAVVAVHSWK